MRDFPKGLLLCVLLGLAGCLPAAQVTPPRPQKVSTAAHPPSLSRSMLRVPDTEITVALGDAFWQGERVPFRGPGADRGTLQQIAEPLTFEQDEDRYTLVPLEVQRVSSAGGLYLVVFPETGSLPATSSTFLGRNTRLLALSEGNGVITATVVDAHLGRPPSATMQPGRTYRFRLEDGALLEVD